MRKAPFLLSPVLVLLFTCTVAAQNLADVARAEEARRKTIKGQVKVYTNDTLRGVDGGPPPAAIPVPAVSGQAAASPAAASTPDPTKTEKYWRDRLTTAREGIKRSQAFFDALQSQINGLYAEFVNMSDPAQRALIEQKRLAAIAEQDRVKADIGKQTRALADIEDEARKASVPAGWLR
jgi:hypothetical protein